MFVEGSRPITEHYSSIQKRVVEKTGIGLSADIFDKFIQKDVNNYVGLDNKGKLKAKGGYVNNYRGTNYFNSMNHPIVDKMVANFFAYDKSFTETILENKELINYQIVCATKGRQWKEIKLESLETGDVIESLGKINRIFPTKRGEQQTIRRYKANEFTSVTGQWESVAKFPNLPARFVIDNTEILGRTIDDYQVDLTYYIDLATQRKNDFLNVG